MDDFELEIKKDFITEAILNLEETEGAFMELESAPDPIPLLERIFRLAHNLKGGSRAVGFGDIAEFTHELENLVLKIQKHEVKLSSEVVTTLLRANDRLIEMLSHLKGDLNAAFDNQELISDMRSWIEGRKPVEMAKLDIGLELTPDAQDFFSGDDLAEIMANSESKAAPAKTSQTQVSPVAPKVEAKSKTAAEKEDEVVRVNLSRINLLNDLVGELIVTQSMVQQQSLNGNGLKLQGAIQQMTKLSKDIQNIAMGLRMLPVKPLVQKLQRVIRDTAQALGKDVDLVIEGEQMDIDKSVLDQIGDPLIHILRNAVDHGLEMRDERVQAKKEPKGHVKLSFAHEGNYLLISVEDDGRGIDAQRLRKKGIEKGLLNESQDYSEKQLLHLVFHAGFSTKEATSEISGRGVGMDVVRSNIEKLGGQVDLSTDLGKGSRFDIKIPLSLAVIEGLVVRGSSGRYVVPLNQVQETIDLEQFHIHRSKLGIGDCIEMRSVIVPLVSLDSLLDSKRMGEVPAKGIALVFEIDNQPIAVAVSEVLRSQQVVIKPLGNGILSQKGWVGTCVLGDGLPSLILNPTDLLETTISQRRAA